MSRCTNTLLISVAFLTLVPARARPGEDLEHALFQAIRIRDDRRVEQILREGTPAHLRDAEGSTTLMVAALWGSADNVRLFIERGVEVNAADVRGMTALHWAAGDLEKVRLLVDAGADVHARNSQGKTVLMLAANYLQNDATIEYLVERGSELEARDALGKTVFQRVVDRASPELVKRLAQTMKSRGTLDRFDPRDWEAVLYNAALRGDIAVLETIHGLLPDPDLINNAVEAGNDRLRPIHAALIAQRADAARWLLDHGARIDVSAFSGGNGSNLLVFSSFLESGDPSVAKTLIERGANPQSRVEDGETALTWARRRGAAELVSFLEKAGVPEHPDVPPTIPERVLKIHAGNRGQIIGEAAERSLSLMLRSSDTFLDERGGCTSCHHQLFPGIAASQARERGLHVDEKAIARLTRRHVIDWNQALPEALSQEFPLVFLTGNGIGLWFFSAVGYPRNLITDAYARQFIEMQLPDGSWRMQHARPPMTGNDLQTVALAILSLREYPVRGRELDVDRTIRRATKWLIGRPARFLDEHVYRLLGLTWAGESDRTWNIDARALLDSQREDGGWAQFDGLASDAWATGHALVALATAGVVRPRDPVYRRGVEFLLRTQFDDGSWFVQRRAIPFQEPFESGFPFGKNQWISITATAWATMALVRAIEPVGAAVVPTRSSIFLEAPGEASQPGDGYDGKDDGERPYKESSDITDAEPAETPRTLEREIIFEKDVAPILSRSCLKCHSGTLPEGELNMTRRGFLLRGGESGKPAIVPGKSAESHLLKVVTSKRGTLQMPPPKKRGEFPPLNENETAILHTWIEQGAKWPDESTISP